MKQSFFTKHLVSVFLTASVVFLCGCFEQQSNVKSGEQQNNTKSDEQKSNVEADENPNNVKKNDQWIVGTWVNMANNSNWVFNADRTGSCKYDGFPTKISMYAIVGNKIALAVKYTESHTYGGFGGNGYVSSETRQHGLVFNYDLSKDGKFLVLSSSGSDKGYLLRKKDDN